MHRLALALLFLGCAEARPASKPETFRPERDQLYVRAHDRSVTAACEEAQCTIWLDGVVVESVTFDGAVAEFVTPLGAIAGQPALFLVAQNDRDVCPRLYQLLQVKDDGAHLSEPFGNCAPLVGVDVANGAGVIALHFAAAEKLGRAAVTYDVRDHDGVFTVTPE